jgi:hypothetical protein
MNHIMLDLETMSSKPDAPIVAIGAVFFEPSTGEIGAAFEEIIDLRSSSQYGKIEADTVLWWLKQSTAARDVISQKNASNLIDGLIEFSDWVGQIENPKDRIIWGNGSGFDNVILRSAYERLGITAPWMHYNDRDVRTIVDLGRTLLGFDPKKDMPFTGERHNAMDDAIHQAKYVSAIYQALAANANPLKKEV